MTDDDPVARVRAVCEWHAPDSHPDTIDAIEPHYPMWEGYRELFDAFVPDVAAALDAKDAEIERLRAEVVRLDRLTDEQVLLIERQEAQLTELRAAYDDLRQRTVNMLTPADIGMVPVDLTVVLDGEDGTPHRRMLWREATP